MTAKLHVHEDKDPYDEPVGDFPFNPMQVARNYWMWVAGAACAVVVIVGLVIALVRLTRPKKKKRFWELF